MQEIRKTFFWLLVDSQALTVELPRDEQQKAFAIVRFVHQDHRSSRPGESHPQALTDPDMNVSAHPALIVQPSPGAA
jgi:hypothetical protein